ncbi:activating transcription factor 4b [Hypomesus transpacificus]|uniref:activating transcription factor 4b n=1 Tax=Hypomesus transpacificus TaxID=137520 RepID=UPI001F0784C9|nr:activating transcription factor 4b [Hypomesus transpacificus]
MTLTNNSPFGPEDMEALLLGPSCLTADPTGALLHLDEEESFTEGGTSPLSSSFSYSSPPLHSLPPSPPSLLFQGDKAEGHMLTLPWLSVDELGPSHSGTNDGKEDAFYGLDWMAERMDLTEFDLDSLVGSCSPEEPPSSPDDLLASLECPVDSLPIPSLPTLPTLCSLPSPPATEPFLPSPASQGAPQEVLSPPPCVPEVQDECEIKSEPLSPGPSPMSPGPSPMSPPFPPLSPMFALDLGSEVDVSDCDSKPPPPHQVLQVPRVVLSLSPPRIVLVLASTEEVSTTSITTTTRAALPQLLSDCNRVSSVSNPHLVSATTTASRSRPYPYPRPCSSTPSSSSCCSGSVKGRSRAGGPPKEKKLKKMEQNKTAATRYRQKKRGEHEALSAEYSHLERRNQELEETADSLAREIEYLKELMEEVRLAKLLKGSGAGNL